MFASVRGAALDGLAVELITVECDLTQGLPCFNMVGLASTSVTEARERVRAALLCSGLTFPMVRITVNLAPADVPKTSPGLDLPVAIGLLAAQKLVPQPAIEETLFFGELGLGGDLRGVRGALQAAEIAREHGLTRVVCAESNAQEAALSGLDVRPASSLRDVVAILTGANQTTVRSDPDAAFTARNMAAFDLSSVRDQPMARRAVEIAAAGGHNLLLDGPPGTGKTMLARALAGVLPQMTMSEALEVTRIQSAAGALLPGQGLVVERPFRAPHHGVSMVGMTGGGSGRLRAGEVSLAHRGVLFLDEFPEFSRHVLEALRQPLEEGVIVVTRAKQTVAFPADFQLVAAMNPCPCGHRHSTIACRCTPNSLRTYERRLSGPLLDRIDLRVTVRRVDPDRALSQTQDESSDAVRDRVERARMFGASRFESLRITCNAQISHRSLLSISQLDPGAVKLLTKAARKMHLSARTVHRLVRVSRTIADLAAREEIIDDHVAEALSLRTATLEAQDAA